jgi:hypothetical protein
LQGSVIANSEGKIMVLASNVVRLVLPAPADAADGRASSERRFVATAAQAWQLQFELAWSYPRLCYALWSRLMRLDR